MAGSTPTLTKGPNDTQLPFEYWNAPERWYDHLTMPGKGMLLITLSLRQPDFALPQDQVPDWYGVSSDTAYRGLKELVEVGLLIVVREDLFPTLKSRTGYAERHIYRLQPPFDLKSRGMGRSGRKTGSS